MIEAGEVRARILAELEEAGQENIPTILNTIFESKGETWEKNGALDAIEELIAQGFTRMAFERDDDGRLVDASYEKSIEIIKGLSETLTFDAVRSLWTDQNINRDDYPELVITDVGWEKSREILEERGYRWWRQPSEA